jgi:putative MATE family efflux protein
MLMLEFAIPSIIGLVVNGLYNIVDAAFLGWGVGTIGLATTTVAMPIMFFGMAISSLIGVGGNALTALKLGEGHFDQAEKVVGNTFTLTVIAAIILTALVLLFIDPILRFCGATAETMAPSRTFVSIIAIGSLFQFFSMGFNNIIRTAGKPMFALLTMVLGLVIGAALNWLFVMMLGWGVAGSAWATVIGQAASAAWMFWYFAFSKNVPFRLRLQNMPPDWPLMRNILALGSASFVLQLANSGIMLLVNHQIASLGAIHAIGSEGALAVLGTVGRVASFSFFPVLGVAIAAQPVFGFNYGATHYDRVKAAFKVAIIWSMVIGVIFFAIIHIFPTQIMGIFNVEGQYMDFAVLALKVQLFCIPLMGVQVISGNYFQSTGQPLKAMFLSLTRQVLYLIPLIYLMPVLIVHIIPGAQPLDGVYSAYPVADVISCLTSVCFMAFEIRRLNRKIREQQGAPPAAPPTAPIAA